MSKPVGKADATPFGDTCPYLNISKTYGVDYGHVLSLADYYMYRRNLPVGSREAFVKSLPGFSLDTYKRLCDDVRTYAERFKQLPAGYAP